MNCPICNSKQISRDLWPQAGTHAFTIPFECGTTVDTAFSSDEGDFHISNACDGSIKPWKAPIDNKLDKSFKVFLKKKMLTWK